MAPGPVRWPWIASSVPSETFSARVRFRGWMSEAEGFLCRVPEGARRTPPRRRLLIQPEALGHDGEHVDAWPEPRPRPGPRPERGTGRRRDATRRHSRATHGHHLDLSR